MSRSGQYNVEDYTQTYILRQGGAVGTKQHQTANGLIWVPPVMNTRFYSGAPFVNVSEGGTIKAFEVQNNAAAANVGVGFRIVNRIWIAGRYDGTTYTDFTSSCQSATGTSTLQVTGADQTGFAIGSLIPFDWVSVNITTAETNAGGVTVVDHDIQYSLGATWSSAIGNVGLTNGFYKANAVWGTGATELVWAKPTAWAKSASLTGVADGYYWLWFTSAEREAGDVAAVATGIEIGVGRFRSQAALNGIYADDFPDLYSPHANGMIAYFSIANANNLVSALVI